MDAFTEKLRDLVQEETRKSLKEQGARLSEAEIATLDDAMMAAVALFLFNQFKVSKTS